MRMFLALVTASCAGASAASAPPSTTEPHAAPPTTATQPFVDHGPGPIAGSYRVTCAENDGEIIELTVSGDHAVGRVVDPGAAKRFGFQKGEEVLRLTADSHGDWVGEVRFRSVVGAQHWDGIRFIATDSTLNAIMTNEPCYKSMPRVR
jgi:hypothetical protein